MGMGMGAGNVLSHGFISTREHTWLESNTRNMCMLMCPMPSRLSQYENI